MHNLVKTACGIVAVGLLLSVSAANAESQSASAGWNDSWGFKTANDLVVDQNGAALQLNVQHGGNGTTVNETVGSETVNQTYNGSVSNSGSTNMNNVTSSSVKAVDSDVTVTTTQSSQTTDQTAASKNLINSTDH